MEKNSLFIPETVVPYNSIPFDQKWDLHKASNRMIPTLVAAVFPVAAFTVLHCLKGDDPSAAAAISETWNSVLALFEVLGCMMMYVYTM